MSGLSRALLTEDEIAEDLSLLPLWAREGHTIVRAVELASFPEAIRTVVKIAEIAEEMDHHPDIDIRWRTLHFSLMTYSEGGLTRLDFAQAARIDGVLSAATSA